MKAIHLNQAKPKGICVKFETPNMKTFPDKTNETYKVKCMGPLTLSTLTFLMILACVFSVIFPLVYQLLSLYVIRMI